HTFYPYTPPSDISTLSLHDALPILSIDKTMLALIGESKRLSPSFIPETAWLNKSIVKSLSCLTFFSSSGVRFRAICSSPVSGPRSEEHTSELQSRENLVCRLLLEKK